MAQQCCDPYSTLYEAADGAVLCAPDSSSAPTRAALAAVKLLAGVGQINSERLRDPNMCSSRVRGSLGQLMALCWAATFVLFASLSTPQAANFITPMQSQP